MKSAPSLGLSITILPYILGAVIYFGYGIRFSNLEMEYSQPATYKVGLDLDSDFDPNFNPHEKPPKTTKGGYEEFQNEE